MKNCFFLILIVYAGFQSDVFSQSECDSPNIQITAELTTTIWAEEISWSILNESDELIAGPFSGFEDNSTYFTSLCIGYGCYYALLEDSYGDGWHGGSIEFNYFDSESDVLNSILLLLLSIISAVSVA